MFASLRDSTTPVANGDDEPDGHIEASCREEIQRYKHLSQAATEATSRNPLVFWRESQHVYPILSFTARRILCIAASSAQSERDFSSLGHSITDQRASLSPKTVEAMELLRWGIKAGIASAASLVD